MTTTSMYLVSTESDSYSKVGELNNSHRSAMYVWNYIAQKYFDLEMFPFFDEELQRRIWNAGNEKELTSDELVVLATTMDRALVHFDDIPLVVEAFRRFGEANLHSSFLEQSECAKVAALGLQGTSKSATYLTWNQTDIDPTPFFIDESDDVDEDGEYLKHVDLSSGWDVYKQLRHIYPSKFAVSE